MDLSPARARPPGADAPEQRLLRGLGRTFQLLALVGLVGFGLYIVLRAAGAARELRPMACLVDGLAMPTAAEWIANLGIGLHFAMGTVLVLAWPILLSRIRSRHRGVHRWTGRVYVTAGVLAGAGGMSFILTHGAYTPAASIAFGLWGAVMMLCAVMAFVHAGETLRPASRMGDPPVRDGTGVLGVRSGDQRLEGSHRRSRHGRRRHQRTVRLRHPLSVLRAQPAGGGVLHPATCTGASRYRAGGRRVRLCGRDGDGHIDGQVRQAPVQALGGG